jgi:hypothetical protein
MKRRGVIGSFDACPLICFCAILAAGSVFDRLVDGLLSVLLQVMVAVFGVVGSVVVRTRRVETQTNTRLAAAWDSTVRRRAARARARAAAAKRGAA